MRSVTTIRAGLSRLTVLAADATRSAPTVSRWSVGEHIDHLIKVNSGILAYFAESAVGGPAATGITLIERIVLFTGHIPRGRGKSSARFLPVMMDVTRLQHELATIAEAFSRLSEEMPAVRDTATRFAHPAFGGLTRRQWLRFAEIHQQHHQAIINDILQASFVTK
jgi:hypothetical protein